MKFYFQLVSVGLLLAGDQPWNGKSVANWTEQDLHLILTDSPWSRTVRANITRLETEDERRDGGKMGQDHGVGYEGVGGKTTRPGLPAGLVRGSNGSTRAAAPPITLALRWESALPVRIAEVKARVIEPPTLPGDGYVLAIYGVPATDLKGDPKSLGNPLRKQAVLKRVGKRDVKPLRVEVFRREDGFAVVYLFALSAEIIAKDGQVEFSAQIGRITIAHSFDLPLMEFQGKLEL